MERTVRLTWQEAWHWVFAVKFRRNPNVVVNHGDEKINNRFSLSRPNLRASGLREDGEDPDPFDAWITWNLDDNDFDFDRSDGINGWDFSGPRSTRLAMHLAFTAVSPRSMTRSPVLG
jgi:hypothetical protein